MLGSHWARKGVQSLRHVVSREVEAVGEELGERSAVLIPVLLRARAHLSERRRILSFPLRRGADWVVVDATRPGNFDSIERQPYARSIRSGSR